MTNRAYKFIHNLQHFNWSSSSWILHDHQKIEFSISRISRIALTVSFHYKIQIRKAQHSNKYSYLIEKQHSYAEQNQKKLINSNIVLFWITEFSNSREIYEKSK